MPLTAGLLLCLSPEARISLVSLCCLNLPFSAFFTWQLLEKRHTGWRLEKPVQWLLPSWDHSVVSSHLSSQSRGQPLMLQFLLRDQNLVFSDSAYTPYEGFLDTLFLGSWTLIVMPWFCSWKLGSGHSSGRQVQTWQVLLLSKFPTVARWGSGSLWHPGKRKGLSSI